MPPTRARALLPLMCLLALLSCEGEPMNTNPTAKLLVHNAEIWTEQGCVGADAGAKAAPCATALLIGSDGRVIATGNDTAAWADQLTPATQRLDAEGAFLMPGFIEGHGHFSGLGSSLRNLNFLKSKSWEEIVAMVEARAEETPAGQWISGRGWHQEKWDKPHDHSVGGYPIHDELSRLTAEHPVILRHASGHALFANQKAMDVAGVTRETPDPPGGRVLRTLDGAPTGVFEERAMDLITDAYQDYLQTLDPVARKDEWLAGIRAAEEECLRKGITTFQDAGTKYQEIEWYKELDAADSLRLNLWVMLRHRFNEMDGNMDGLPHYGDRFTCAAIKSELDGALGSYGAWLLESYADNPGFTGQNTTTLATVDSIARLALANDMQLCVHAIGDKANRETLNLMATHLEAGNDRRWRIEHAQHLHPDDIPRFAQLGVIAAMQGIHCTSDALFAENRLGEERAREGAYPWRSLLDAGAVIVNGTDAPVEDVDPLASFYASVTRARTDASGVDFFPEQAMTREEALHSYTGAAAYGAFMEQERGRLVPGQWADFVLLSGNLLTLPETELTGVRVLETYVAGERGF